MVYVRRYKYTRGSRRVLKTGAGHDERRDGLARKLRKHERGGVHRGVVVPKRLELGTLCARRRVETRVVRVRANARRGEGRGGVVIEAGDEKPTSILRSLRQNKRRQRSRIFSNFIVF